MFSRQLEQLARQRDLERGGRPAIPAAAARAAAPRQTIRSQTGWALVAIGLRIAASSSR